MTQFDRNFRPLPPTPSQRLLGASPPPRRFSIGSPTYGFSRGEFQYFDPEQGNRVVESFTCGHCNRLTKIQPFCDPADAGGFCPRCTRLVCKRCAGAGMCDPIEAKLERSEKFGESIRSGR